MEASPPLNYNYRLLRFPRNKTDFKIELSEIQKSKIDVWDSPALEYTSALECTDRKIVILKWNTRSKNPLRNFALCSIFKMFREQFFF